MSALDGERATRDYLGDERTRAKLEALEKSLAAERQITADLEKINRETESQLLRAEQRIAVLDRAFRLAIQDAAMYCTHAVYDEAEAYEDLIHTAEAAIASERAAGEP